MASAAVSSRGGSLGPRDDAPLQGCGRALDAQEAVPDLSLRRRASIQRRLMPPELPAVEIASHAAPVHRDWSSARPDGAGCCRFDRQTHVVTQRQRLSSRRRCQLEPVLRAGDDLRRWNDAGGSYQIALEEPRISKIVQARHSSRSALSSTTAATWWWLGRGARVAVPGRNRRFRQSHPIVSCSPCHVHHKSVGGLSLIHI